jgi:diaminopimelate decarboxylase
MTSQESRAQVDNLKQTPLSVLDLGSGIVDMTEDQMHKSWRNACRQLQNRRAKIDKLQPSVAHFDIGGGLHHVREKGTEPPPSSQAVSCSWLTGLL